MSQVTIQKKYFITCTVCKRKTELSTQQHYQLLMSGVCNVACDACGERHEAIA